MIETCEGCKSGDCGHGCGYGCGCCKCIGGECDCGCECGCHNTVGDAMPWIESIDFFIEPCDCCDFSDCCGCGELECTCHCECDCHEE